MKQNKNSIPSEASCLIIDLEGSSTIDMKKILPLIGGGDPKAPLDLTKVKPWEANEKVKSELESMLRNLHAFCKEHQLPMMTLVQTAHDGLDPEYGYAAVGASDKSSRMIDVMKEVYMLMFDGSDAIDRFNRQELISFCNIVDNTFIARRK